MKWRVLTEKNPGWVEAEHPDAYRIFMATHSEVVEADKMFTSASGVLSFLKKPLAEPSTEPPVMKRSFNPKTKRWITRKVSAAPTTLICVRAFNRDAWTDVRIEP